MIQGDQYKVVTGNFQLHILSQNSIHFFL